MNGPHLVGVTGPTGSGKSLLCRFLSDAHGWPVLDADQIGHEALEPNSPVQAAVIGRFGPGIVGSDGRIERAALSRVVFRDPAELEALNDLVHPWILMEIARRMDALKAQGYAGIILLDAALLPAWLDRIGIAGVVYVGAAEEARQARLVAKGLSRPEAECRISAQDGLFVGPVAPTWLVVENGGSIEEFRAVARALGRLLEERFPE